MTYSLIIPIYNEERTLSALLKKLDRLDNNIEIIIIDDGSNDGSDLVLANLKDYNVLRNESNIGKGASILKGVNSAKNQNIILMDGDLEIDINDIPKLITRFETSSNDAIVGMRWKKDGDYNFEINTIGNYIINLTKKKKNYKKLCSSAYHYYFEDLSWDCSGKKIKKLLKNNS